MTRPLDHHDEATLVARTLAGEREAFVPLAERYYPGVLRLCTRLIGSVTEAEDMAQEAFVKAYLNLSELRAPEQFGAWLHAIAVNTCRLVLRRPTPVSLEAIDGYRHLVSHRPTAEEITADRELHETLMHAIDSLSEVNREVVVGFYLEGYSYQELENILDVPVNKVKSRLFKARRDLRRKLAPVMQDYIPETSVGKEQPMKSPDQVAVEIEQVIEKTMANESIIIFHVIDREQYLVLRLNHDESRTLETAMKNEGQEMPVSYDLSFRLLEQLGATVDHILIDQLVEHQCIARITVSQNGKTQTLDVRVGEAVALAFMCKAPMYVTIRTLEAIGIMLHVDRRTPPELKDNPYNKSKRQYNLSDGVWRFMMETQFQGIDEPTYATLKKESLEKLFPTKRTTWEGQDVSAIEITYDNPGDQPGRRQDKLWVLVPPYIADVYEEVNESLKGEELSWSPIPVKPDPPLDDTTRKEIDRIMSDGFKELYPIGIATMALMSRNGNMISGYSEISQEEAETVGINHVRDSLIGDYIRRLASIPAMTGYGFYSRGNLVWGGMKDVTYSEEIDVGGWGPVNRHWIVSSIGFERSSNNPEVNDLMQRIQNELEQVLPDPYED